MFHDPIFGMSHGSLKRTYILLLDGVFCKYRLDPIGWWCGWIYIFVDFSTHVIIERRVLKSPAIIVAFSFLVLYLAALLVGA